MAMTYGHLLMGKHKQEDLEAIHKEARKQQKKARKKGLWSSIGGTLGGLAAPMLMGALGVGGGPLGALAGKMIISRLGREAGEELAGPVSKKAVREAGEHGFHKDIRGQYTAGLDQAQDTLNKQQWVQSVINPLQEYGIGKAGEQLKGWAEGTKAGQDYAKWVDEGGLKIGEKLGNIPGLSQIGQFVSSPFQQVPLEERWDYEPEDVLTGSSYEED